MRMRQRCEAEVEADAPHFSDQVTAQAAAAAASLYLGSSHVLVPDLFPVRCELDCCTFSAKLGHI